jgi:flagellar protein FlaF
MGFSVSGAMAVILVGLLVSMATLYPAVDRSQELRREAIDDRNERLLDRQNTAITIRSATYNATSDELTVAVENTGSTSLSVDRTGFLVDGEYRTDAATAIDGASNRTVWTPSERLAFTDTHTTAPARVKVVTERGIAATAAVTEVA